jgi:hypothetical protein
MASVTDTRVVELALSHDGLASQLEPLSIAGSSPEPGPYPVPAKSRLYTTS